MVTRDSTGSVPRSSQPAQSAVIVPLRPRDQVPRSVAIGSFRSDPNDFELRYGLSPRIRLHGGVRVGELIRGLASVGLKFRLDERTGELYVFPRPDDEQRPTEGQS